ncbi:MAG: radical SAM protein [Bacillota bacterium]
MNNKNTSLHNLHWSKYNKLLKSQKYGYLLYNSLTNSLADLDNYTYSEIQKIKKDPKNYDYSKKPMLYLQLLQNKILVTPNQEEDFINQRKLKKRQQQYDNHKLTLAIAPTTACNFNCSYCFEANEKKYYITDEIEAEIINFIERFFPLKGMHISWYGGEPLLSFDRIKSLNKKIKGLGVPYQSSLITNGYLFDTNKIKELKNLKLQLLQITVDGPEEIHNQRRTLKNGKGTYKQIMNNISEILSSAWKGILKLRVNIDRSNLQSFAQFYQKTKKEFPSEQLKIYPGIISDLSQDNLDLGCAFDRDEEMNFYLKLFEDYGIKADSFYPSKKVKSCIADTKNAYVIGPTGNLYKCLNDIGVEKMRVGNIKNQQVENKDLLSRYLIASDYYQIEECKNCFYLPVCNGGCPKKRIKKLAGEKNEDFCLKFKGNFKKMLETYYQLKMENNENN